MDGPVLALWSATVSRGASVPLVPDGCRDLIARQDGSGRIRLFFSELDDTARTVRVCAGDRWAGLRLRPGATVNEPAFGALHGEAVGADLLAGGVPRHLDGLVHVNADASEALAAIAALGDGAHRTRSLAARLGVSARTLQRLMVRHTGRSPDYWRRLVRARRAARAIRQALGFAEVAADHGYCDQAHLCRELGHWFGAPPGVLARAGPLAERLTDRGYD